MNSMLKYSLVVGAVVIMVVLVGQGITSSQEAAQFVGAAKCKICHNKPESGEQFATWQKAGHSKAFATLATEAALATGKKLGIDDPQKSPKCLKCHSTAYFFSETPVKNIELKKDGTPRLAVEEGVGCESCHWAGSLYEAKKVMESFDASVKGGMNPKPEESCVKCHNADNPNWDPNRYTLKDGTKSGFDYAQAYEKIKHPNPLMAEARAKRKAGTK
jgi:Fe-S-cluster-containing dehydrogenase component